MTNPIRGQWNIVLSGYPRAGKTTLAEKLVSDHQCFTRISADELRKMLFNEIYPSRDEFLIYSLIAELRDAILKRGYSVVIDSTAPDNVTREFLLTTKAKHINELLVMLSLDRDLLVQRNIEKFGDAHPIVAYDEKWQNPRRHIPIFKFRNGTKEEFSDYYARLVELLESEMHPFKPEFRHVHLPTVEIRKALRNFLKTS